MSASAARGKQWREEQKADSAKRERLKKYEREKYLKRKADGKVKLVGNLNSHQRRALRNQWQQHKLTQRSKQVRT